MERLTSPGPQAEVTSAVRREIRERRRWALPETGRGRGEGGGGRERESSFEIISKRVLGLGDDGVVVVEGGGE